MRRQQESSQNREKENPNMENESRLKVVFLISFIGVGAWNMNKGKQGIPVDAEEHRERQIATDQKKTISFSRSLCLILSNAQIPK